MQLQVKQKELYFKTFLMGIILSAAFFVPFMIADQGYFLYFGDFNVQQVTFYQLAHRAIRNGEWFWSFKTDLGANFIGSYSFYLLGSPFFWLTIPFPNSFVPYLMGPLLILKFGCAAVSAYAFITRFVKNKDLVLIGALLYAFSGFSLFNVFFNHFHEPIIAFPLLLLSLEMFVVERRRGVFALMVGICAVTNYFFFWGMVVFAVIYFFLRLFSGEWKINLADFALMAFEAVLGLVLSAILLWPSILAIVEQDRVAATMAGYSSLLYGKEQIYAYVFQSFFFPPEIPARPVFFEGADVKWSSVAGWLPVFSMTGVIAWLQSKKKNWKTRMIWICFVMAMVPILNASFYAFNDAYYARWFYMPILIMCIMTVKGFEDDEVDMQKGWRTTTLITLLTVLIVGFFPNGKNDGTLWEKLGLYIREFDYRFWIICAIAVASLVITRILLQVLKTEGFKRFTRLATLSVALVSVLYSAVYIGLGKTHSYLTTDFIIPTLLKGDIELEDDDSVRFDVYEGMDNTAMFFDLSSINAFHSVIPNSVIEFYHYLGEERDVGSRPDADLYAIRSFLSVKYVLNHKDDTQFDASGGATGGTMPYYLLHSRQNDYKIFENQCYIPYGFTYDYYISVNDTIEMTDSDKMLTLVKAIRLGDNQIKKYPFLKNINGIYDSETMGTVRDYSVEQYYRDCQARAATAGKTVFGKNSFTHYTNLESENLVFFSIPYDDGWTATVDGKEVEIEQANVGFMAVYCEAGEHTIEFHYRTPGLSLGIILSGASALVLAGYIGAVYVYRKKRAESSVFTVENTDDTQSPETQNTEIFTENTNDGNQSNPLQAPSDTDGV